ncbi:MAG: hypothetical protein MHM6MM_006328 [Cercozoa sp. M6MM]
MLTLTRQSVDCSAQAWRSRDHGVLARQQSRYRWLPARQLDKAGHKYGPVSDEVDECLQRMDMLVGRLVEALDSAFGDD